MAEEEIVQKIKFVAEADKTDLVELVRTLRDVSKSATDLSKEATDSLKNFATQATAAFNLANAAAKIKPELKTDEALKKAYEDAKKFSDAFQHALSEIGETTKESAQQTKLWADQMRAAIAVAQAGANVEKTLADAQKARADAEKALAVAREKNFKSEVNESLKAEITAYQKLKMEQDAAGRENLQRIRTEAAERKKADDEQRSRIREEAAERRKAADEQRSLIRAQAAEQRQQAAPSGGRAPSGIAIGIAASATQSAISAVSSAVSDGIKIITDYTKALQSGEVAFKGMMGSADGAKQHLTELSEFAAKTPFQFTDVIEASRTLQGYGFAAADVIPTLTALGNIAGGNADRFNRLTYAYSEVFEKQRLMSQDLRQFESAGVPILQTLATAYGTTATEVKKMVEEGRIGFPHVKWALEELSRTRFADQLIEQSKTLSGQISNLKDRVGILGNKMFDPIAKAMADAIGEVNSKLSGSGVEDWAKQTGQDIAALGRNVTSFATTVLPKLGEVANAFAGMANSVGAANGAMAAFTAGAVISVIDSIIAKIGELKAFIGGLNPLTLAIMAGAFLGGAVAGKLEEKGGIFGITGQGIRNFVEEHYRTPIRGALELDRPRTPSALSQQGKDLADMEVNQELKAASALAKNRRDIDELVESIRKLREENGITAEEYQDALRKNEEALAAERHEIELNIEAAKDKNKVEGKAPDPLDKVSKAIGAHKAEKKSLEELIAEYYALQAIMEQVKATVASGDLLGAARMLVEVGKSNEQAVSEVLSIQKDQAAAAERAMKEAADRAKEARDAFLDLANTLMGQVAKAFEALSGASSTSAQSIVNLIATLGRASGSSIARALNIPLGATKYTKPGEEPPAGGYTGPEAGRSGGSDSGFGEQIANILAGAALGIGEMPWRRGEAGEGLIKGISAGIGGAAGLAAKGGFSLDDINTGITAAGTSLAEFGHWVGSNLQGAMKDAAGSTIGSIEALLKMAAEAEGDSEKLAYLKDVISALIPDLERFGKAAKENAEITAAARKAGVYFGEYDSPAVLKAQTELVTKTRKEELEAAKRNYEISIEAQKKRGKYGFSEDQIAATAGGEEGLYQAWFKARFGLTRSELEVENANWKLHEETLERARLLHVENEHMKQRQREAEGWRRQEEDILMRGLNISRGQLYGTEGLELANPLRRTLDDLIALLNSGINAYIEPNHAADKLGSALDRRSALLSGAGGFGPGVF